MGSEKPDHPSDVVSPSDAADVPVSQQGPTLLPWPIAHSVSFATRSTNLAIRVGSLVGSRSLDAAKFTTLSSLQLARGLVEGVLTRAGKDTALRSRSDFAIADAETVLERSLESLHYAMTQVVFWTSASFNLTGTAISAASDASQLLLSSLDQVFGSTDSSRAIATIVTLIRHEFNNPSTGLPGERVGVIDLLVAFGALAYLQRSCAKTAPEQQRRHACEETIWDIVVLDDGERVDVLDSTNHGDVQMFDEAQLDGVMSSASPQGYHGQWHQHEDDEVVLARLKDQIAASLAPGTTVSISNSVSSVQTITVEVDGPQPIPLISPPGAEIVERRGPPSPTSRNADGDSAKDSYRVVYKIERNKLRGATLQKEEHEQEPSLMEVTQDPIRDYPTSKSQITLLPTDNQSQPPNPAGLASERKRRYSLTAETVGTTSRAVSEPAPSRTSENVPNQKKPRTPASSKLSKPDGTSKAGKALTAKKTAVSRKGLDHSVVNKPPEKKGGLKQALKGGSQSISNIWKPEAPSADTTVATTKSRPQWKTPSSNSSTGGARLQTRKQAPAAARGHVATRSLQSPEAIPRSSSRASYVSVHEHRRDSIVSQTDTYSIHSTDGLRPASPTFSRAGGQDLAVRPPSRSFGGHRRTRSHVPSIYSLGTNDSQGSLVLSAYYRKSAYSTADALNALRREGFVDGAFPAGPLLHNISRYMRFSSASYGSQFLKLMGISKSIPTAPSRDVTHQDVRHFVHHTSSTTDDVLLASFVDAAGGSDATGATGTGVPLIHYVSLDHEAKAVVLACRGTLGFEDVLADMTCDYDSLPWRGRSYRVHKGIHASARRLLYGGDGRVLVTIKEALREFPEYGVVLCGHSLGAAVTALLGIMLAEPNPNGTGFVTSANPHMRLLTGESDPSVAMSDNRLPPGRRIHVYAYGPPGVMSTSLSKITKGLITTVVHGSDLVPHLSLGLLHDFQAIALSFKKDENSSKAELRQRIWAAFQNNMTTSWYHQSSPPNASSAADAIVDDEQWMLRTLAALRGSMKGEKLLPPGEVFAVESQRVLRRDAFLLRDEDHIGRPARRVVLKYIKDVSTRFGEVRFGTSMLTDHSPAKYEEALNKLRLGVVE